jgi:hypothetical protein
MKKSTKMENLVEKKAEKLLIVQWDTSSCIGGGQRRWP